MAAQESDDLCRRRIAFGSEHVVELHVVAPNGLYDVDDMASVLKPLGERNRLGRGLGAPFGIEDEKRRRRGVVLDVMPGRDLIDVLCIAEHSLVERHICLGKQLGEVIDGGVERDHAAHRGGVNPCPLQESRVGAEQRDEVGASGMADQEEPVRIATELSCILGQPAHGIGNALGHFRHRRIRAQSMVRAGIDEALRHERQRLQKGLILAPRHPASAMHI